MGGARVERDGRGQSGEMGGANVGRDGRSQCGKRWAQMCAKGVGVMREYVGAAEMAQ